MNSGRLFWPNLILADSLFSEIFFFVYLGRWRFKVGQIRGERHLVGGVMHTWRFTWQTFSPEKRHVRRQFEVFSMPD